MRVITLHAPRLSNLTRVVLLAGAYFLAGWLGHRAAFLGGTFQLVWPASGLALGAILLYGYGYWPGVALGAVVFALGNGLPMDVFTLGIVVGNTFGALLCAFLLERLVRFQPEMERVWDVAGFVGLACVLGTTVNAVSTAVAQAYEGEVAWTELWPVTLEWWVPNAMACLVVAPLLLSWASPASRPWPARALLEALVCWGGLIVGTLVSFTTWYAYGIENYPLALLPYPFLVWAALRFGQKGASVATLSVAVVAIGALLQGRGPFVASTEKESLMLVGSYIGIVAVTNLMLAAAASERRRAEEALRRSEEMFRLITENTTDLIAMTDADGQRLYCSPSYRGTLGDSSKLKGTNAFAEIHPEDRDRVREVFQETIRSGTGRRIEFRFLLPDGSVRHIESQGNYIRGTSTDRDRVVTVARDITDRRRDEESLRLLASAVRFSDDAIIITGPPSGGGLPPIVFANPAFTRMAGYAAEETVGATLDILHGPKTDRAQLAELCDHLTRGEPCQGLTIHYRKDGSEFHNEWHFEPIRDAEGRVTHFLAVQRDVTARKQIEADLAKARDDALVSAKLKAEFLANMSHEIRTPMNGILGMTHLLLQTELNTEQNEYADSIRASAESLLTIINDILDFSKIEAGKLTLETVDFDLRDTVESTVEILAQAAATKAIELTQFVHPDVPDKLRGDPHRLRQILSNLVGNAIKFTEQGEVAVRVSKERESELGVVLRFEVRDTGIGIPQDAQGRLFAAFTQADGSMTRKYGGTGMGLAISRQLVGLMRGQIGLDSVEGQGSTFWFSVPLARQQAELEAPSAAPAELFHLRTLVVDDNATCRQILLYQTRSWNLRSEPASSGPEALQKLQAGAQGDPYRVAIVDMGMSGMDGLRLARLMRAGALTAEVRIVLLASLGRQPDPETLARAGVSAFLVKPVKQARLLETLVSVVTGRPIAGPSPQKTAADAGVPSLPPLRILLAEDHPINQKVALGQLRRLGYTADLAKSGREAISSWERERYDVILMDCQMPDLDGYEATRVIRRREQDDPARPQTRIIAMTAHAMQGDRERCLEAGMDDYVRKPFEEEDLVAALQKCQPACTPAGGAAPAPAPAPPAAPAAAPAHEPAPVDMARLTRVTLGDAENLRETVRIYFEQAGLSLAAARAAVASRTSADLAQAAHKLSGSSSTCGFTAIVPMAVALERMGYAGHFDDAEALLARAGEELERMRRYMNDHLARTPLA